MTLQQRVREGREQKRAELDERHDYIFGIVADHLGLEVAHVEDALLEGSQVIWGRGVFSFSTDVVSAMEFFGDVVNPQIWKFSIGLDFSLTLSVLAGCSWLPWLKHNTAIYIIM